MITIPTEQGIATPETALCVNCDTPTNRGFAREQAANTNDIDPTGDFVDCSENDVIDCCICGQGIYGLA